MRRWINLSITIATLSLSTMAGAHEFWMRADPFSPKVGAQVRLQMYVGQYFEGDQVGYVTSHTAMLQHYAGGLKEDLIGLVPSTQPIGQIPLTIKRAGTHLIAFDSHASPLTLEAGKFEAYLHDEGLDAIVQQRAQKGQSDAPGRERFRRNTKTLIRAGGVSDDTYAVRTGQRLELVPLADPLSQPPGTPLRFKVLFDSQPLAGALLRAWHHHGDQTVSIRSISDRDGAASFNLPYSGPWMISTVQMVASSDPAIADWDSFWGNLMFEVPAGK